MLVLRRVHVVAQGVGGAPEVEFEADGGGGVIIAIGHLTFLQTLLVVAHQCKV